MTKEKLQARMAELQSFIDQSAANHNALVGRLEEIKMLLNSMDAPAEPVQE